LARFFLHPATTNAKIAQVALLVTWLCLLVGDSLFNIATTTGAINQTRQVRISQTQL
jgi:hypothetical protein